MPAVQRPGRRPVLEADRGNEWPVDKDAVARLGAAVAALSREEVVAFQEREPGAARRCHSVSSGLAGGARGWGVHGRRVLVHRVIGGRPAYGRDHSEVPGGRWAVFDDLELDVYDVSLDKVGVGGR
jgi:hypothetical protein